LSRTLSVQRTSHPADHYEVHAATREGGQGLLKIRDHDSALRPCHERTESADEAGGIDELLGALFGGESEILFYQCKINIPCSWSDGMSNLKAATLRPQRSIKSNLGRMSLKAALNSAGFPA